MPRTGKKILETDLYKPIHDYLVANGYTVRSEVENCDITARRGEELIIIEMKCRFETRLLVQAARRQRITESVYIALPRPKGGTRTSRWRGIVHLLHRLELGLIFVSPRRRRMPVDVVFHPLPYTPRKKKAARRAVLREIENRSGDFNTGGCVRRKIVTAYRENAIHIACALAKFGPIEPRRLRALGTGEKTTSILYDNHYRWFERIDRGVYALKARGISALKRYPELAQHYGNLLNKRGADMPGLQARSAPS
jgi:hypothetical protein